MSFLGSKNGKDLMVDWAWIPHVAFVLISKSKGRNLVFLFYVPIHNFVSQKHFDTGLGIDLLCVSPLWVSFLYSAYYFMRTEVNFMKIIMDLSK